MTSVPLGLLFEHKKRRVVRVSDFFIPRTFFRFADQVERRFEMLLRSRVITGIEFNDLHKWWRNFESEEDRYLAAHLLDSLVYRTDAMLMSSSVHILHMILPNALEKLSKARWSHLSDFLQRVRAGDTKLRLRFLSVEGKLCEESGKTVVSVAKSGPAVLRLFQRATGVPDALLIHPDQIRTLPGEVDVLVILDDCLGTGTQFTKFARAYDFANQGQRRSILYVPFVAHATGIEALRTAVPQAHVHPVEVLGQRADFFSPLQQEGGTWRRDKKNTVDAVRAHYAQVLRRRNVEPFQARYGLNLSLAFGLSTPNNTLKAFFTDEGTWNRLFVR